MIFFISLIFCKFLFFCLRSGFILRFFLMYLGKHLQHHTKRLRLLFPSLLSIYLFFFVQNTWCLFPFIFIWRWKIISVAKKYHFYFFSYFLFSKQKQSLESNHKSSPEQRIKAELPNYIPVSFFIFYFLSSYTLISCFKCA